MVDTLALGGGVFVFPVGPLGALAPRTTATIGETVDAIGSTRP